MLTLLLLFPWMQSDLRAGSHQDGEETAVSLYFISLLKSVQSTSGIASPQTPKNTPAHSHTSSKQMAVKLNGEGPGSLSWKTGNILCSLKQNFRSHSDDPETSFSPFFLPWSLVKTVGPMYLRNREKPKPEQGKWGNHESLDMPLGKRRKTFGWAAAKGVKDIPQPSEGDRLGPSLCSD